MLEPFKPEGVQNLKSEFVSQKSVPTWTGMDAWESAICVNKVELEKRKLPIPKTWKDLTNPFIKLNCDAKSSFEWHRLFRCHGLDANMGRKAGMGLYAGFG